MGTKVQYFFILAPLKVVLYVVKQKNIFYFRVLQLLFQKKIITFAV